MNTYVFIYTFFVELSFVLEGSCSIFYTGQTRRVGLLEIQTHYSHSRFLHWETWDNVGGHFSQREAFDHYM